MSFARTEAITDAFVLWTKRLTPPRLMSGDAEAITAECEAMLRVFMRYAPAEGYVDWFAEVIDVVAAKNPTRVYPSIGELHDACRTINRLAPASVGPSGTPVSSPVQIAAARIRAGQPVGDPWLWGRGAREMLAAGLVSEDEVRRYRDAAQRARARTYGDAAAGDWRADRDRQDAELDRPARDRPDRGSVRVPDLRPPYAQVDA